MRFNSRYGDTFVVPKATVRPAGARVMDLQDPTRKMSKSEDSPAGTILLLEEPGASRQEDQAGGHRHRGRGPLRPGRPSPACRTCSRSSRPAPAARPRQAAEGYTQYGPLKSDTADAVVELLAPDPGPARRAGRRPRPRCTASSTTAPSGPARPRRRPSPGPAPRWGCSRPDDEPAADRALDAGASGSSGATRRWSPACSAGARSSARRPRHRPCSCPRRPTPRRRRRSTPAARAPSAPPIDQAAATDGVRPGASARRSAGEPAHRRRRSSRSRRRPPPSPPTARCPPGSASSAAPARSTTSTRLQGGGPGRRRAGSPSRPPGSSACGRVRRCTSGRPTPPCPVAGVYRDLRPELLADPFDPYWCSQAEPARAPRRLRGPAPAGGARRPGRPSAGSPWPPAPGPTGPGSAGSGSSRSTSPRPPTAPASPAFYEELPDRIEARLIAADEPHQPLEVARSALPFVVDRTTTLAANVRNAIQPVGIAGIVTALAAGRRGRRLLGRPPPRRGHDARGPGRRARGDRRQGPARVAPRGRCSARRAGYGVAVLLVRERSAPRRCSTARPRPTAPAALRSASPSASCCWRVVAGARSRTLGHPPDPADPPARSPGCPWEAVPLLLAWWSHRGSRPWARRWPSGTDLPDVDLLALAFPLLFIVGTVARGRPPRHRRARACSATGASAGPPGCSWPAGASARPATWRSSCSPRRPPRSACSCTPARSPTPSTSRSTPRRRPPGAAMSWSRRSARRRCPPPTATGRRSSGR